MITSLPTTSFVDWSACPITDFIILGLPFHLFDGVDAVLDSCVIFSVDRHQVGNQISHF
jgi:hypothetical protein